MLSTKKDNQHIDFDYIIIGSGFGGSVCALRLVEKKYRVLFHGLTGSEEAFKASMERLGVPPEVVDKMLDYIGKYNISEKYISLPD